VALRSPPGTDFCDIGSSKAPASSGAFLLFGSPTLSPRHCERSEAIQISVRQDAMDRFAEPVIGRAFARSVGPQRALVTSTSGVVTPCLRGPPPRSGLSPIAFEKSGFIDVTQIGCRRSTGVDFANAQPHKLERKRCSAAHDSPEEPCNDFRLCAAERHCIRSTGTAPLATFRRQPARRAATKGANRRKPMARLLSIIGFLALAIGLLWIGQGTGAIPWPRSSFMINQLQWAGYGAVLGAVGLILIWQGNR